MPKEEYNLRRVLEMRERARDDAAAALAETRRLLGLAEDELQNRVQAVENCRLEQVKISQEMAENLRAGMRSSEIVRYRQYLTDLRGRETKLLEAVEEQKFVVGRAEKAGEKDMDALNEAAKELKVIEKHRENWQKKIKKKAAKKEERLNDEISQIIYERQGFE